MKLAFKSASIKPKLFFFSLFIFASALSTQAQNYWDKVPALTTKQYSENDDFGSKVELVKREIKENLEKSKRSVEEKANRMTQEERMAMATKYQNMKPEEIIKMQNEMMEIRPRLREGRRADRGKPVEPHGEKIHQQNAQVKRGQ